MLVCVGMYFQFFCSRPIAYHEVLILTARFIYRLLTYLHTYWHLFNIRAYNKVYLLSLWPIYTGNHPMRLLRMWPIISIRTDVLTSTVGLYVVGQSTIITETA